MKAFFDTSALIPCFLEDHEHHEASLKAFLKANVGKDCCGAHTLAEIYAVLTRLPGRHRLSGDQVMLFVENVRERLTIVPLDSNEVVVALREAAAEGVAGGAIYDTLLARCALTAGADTIYTWNVKHFRKFGPEAKIRVRTP